MGSYQKLVAKIHHLSISSKAYGWPGGILKHKSLNTKKLQSIFRNVGTPKIVITP